MSANLEEAINLVYRAEPDLHSIEKTILKQFENPTEYYYDAIYLIVNHYGDLVLLILSLPSTPLSAQALRFI